MNDTVYYSVAQILCQLADTQHLFCELGRGSGKTTHILAPRLDRVVNSMPGSVMVFAAATYKSIFDNLLPGVIEYLASQYQENMYFCVGKTPPSHFQPCKTWIKDYRHTISFCNGTVVQFVSCDRPESMLGKNAVHLFVDEMIRIPEDKFIERVMPALRGNRAEFGASPYFMGITGTSSTPNFETDEQWFLRYEDDMHPETIQTIQQLAIELNRLFLKQASVMETISTREKAKISQLQELLNKLRKGETYYLRASSFSNIKILGIDYILNQIKTIKDEDTLLTSIFSVRKDRVKDLFFARFGKQHIYYDSYKYDHLDNIDAREAMQESQTKKGRARELKHYNPNTPLYIGYDPGVFCSVVCAQRPTNKKEFRVQTQFWHIHPEQQIELAQDINNYYEGHKNKYIYLHFDRAANQRDPQWKRGRFGSGGDVNDTDAILLKRYLERLGWRVQLMSLNQPTIFYSQQLRLVTRLFGESVQGVDKILIDGNECEALISSIYHSPLKRTDGRIELDKSSEKLLEYKDQAYYSTQIASAFIYLLWGEYAKTVLPSSDTKRSAATGMTFIGK